MEPIKVLIVEDSALMRNFLADRIGNAPGFTVVATAHNGADAKEKLLTEAPDVITLDVELPEINGLDLLEQIMRTKPTAVVMVSGHTQSGAQATLRALELGAVDFVAKPGGSATEERDDWIGELLLKLRRAARIRPSGTFALGGGKRVAMGVRSARKCTETAILVGVGSGATEAASRFLRAMPRDCPALLVALQCSTVVTNTLLSQLSRECPLQLKLATDGEAMVRGHVYLSSADAHVSVTKPGRQWQIKRHPGEPIRGFRPCLDLLFESASNYQGEEIAGVLLDAAGDDGVAGLKLLSTNHSRAFHETRKGQVTNAARAEHASGATHSFAAVPVILPLDRIVEALFG